MGACLASEVRKELNEIKGIHAKTQELKQCKRVLVVGAPQSGKTSLIHQAFSTKSQSYYDYKTYTYDMGPFIITEHAMTHSLSTFGYAHKINDWQNMLTYYPDNNSDNNTEHIFDFDTLFDGFLRKFDDNKSFNILSIIPIGIRNIICSYYSRPFIVSYKGGMYSINPYVEFWELSTIDYTFWSYCCKQIIGIIYVIDLSCYNLYNYDNKTHLKTTNKMSVAIDNFKTMINNKYLPENTAFFVFFNKIDLFRDKILNGISIKECKEFKGYSGNDNNYVESLEYIQNKFDKINKNRLLYLHSNISKQLVIFDNHANEYNEYNEYMNTTRILNEFGIQHITEIWNKFTNVLNYHWTEIKDMTVDT